jgi:hypothetical protein
MGETILFRTNDKTPLWVEDSVPGNIFFGYIGTYVGFEGWMTHVGAGYAEGVDPDYEPIRNVCDRFYLRPQWWKTLNDDPPDYQAIQLGINMWRKYRANLTLQQLKTEFEQNYSKLATAPEMPGVGETSAYGWRNPRGGWPYDIGRFNGPNEHRYWPPRLTDPAFWPLGGD